MKFNQIQKITATWVLDEDAWVYEEIPGSRAVHPASIRFKLREIYGEDYDFEVVLTKNGASYRFKTDYYDDYLSKDFDLRTFKGTGETILFYSGDLGLVYFHLES